MTVKNTIKAIDWEFPFRKVKDNRAPVFRSCHSRVMIGPGQIKDLRCGVPLEASFLKLDDTSGIISYVVGKWHWIKVPFGWDRVGGMVKRIKYSDGTIWRSHSPDHQAP
jgi:hypothetical protein